MKKIILTIAIICLAMGSVFATGSKDKSETQKMTSAVMGTGSMGGSSHATASMIATQIKKHTPELTITVQAGGGSAEGIRLIRQGEYQFAFINSAMIVYSFNAQAEFAKDQPYKDIRFVCNLYPAVAQPIVRKDSNINSYTDLKGRIFSGGSPGSGDLVMFEEIFNFYGLTTKDMDWRPLSNTERVSAFKDRHIQSGGWVTTVPAGNILEIAAGTPLRILAIDKVDDFLKKYPYYSKFIISKGIYNGVEEDVVSASVGQIIASRADVPDDMVYTYLKGMYMGLDELQKVHGMAHYIKLETALDGSKGVPVHAGALKYYKEKGIIK
ncbi:MAG: TAXI family TRAP transporter solute-binding subunit [Spirochaetaceae bacterium]|nr:TAXI family TRAP transporter solute-binding subunit [Spirochaetaceae bacterium]